MLNASSPLFQFFQSVSLASIVTLLVGIATPFAESYLSFARPSARTHDATLRLLNLLLNVGLALGAAALLGQLANGPAILAALGYALAQAAGSHVLYDVVNNGGAGAASAATPSTPSTPSTPPAPVDPVVAASASAQQALTTSMASALAANLAIAPRAFSSLRAGIDTLT